MPVRGTTRWNHAIVQRKVINRDHDDGKKVMCAWDICLNDGYETNKVVVNDAKPGYEPRPLTYVFCCERHRQYWINSVRDYGNLPSGYGHGRL